MSLQTLSHRALQRFTSTFGQRSVSSPLKVAKKGSRPSLTQSALNRALRSFSSSSCLYTKSSGKSALDNVISDGNVNDVRAAYRAKQAGAKQASDAFKSTSTPSSKAQSSDILEDILNAALPNRPRDTTPDFGDIEGLKRQVRDSERAEGELSLSELRAREAEEDRAWRPGQGNGEEEEYGSFGADAPVKVPQEVFELNAQAQFSFLKEEYFEALDYLEQSLRLIRSRLGEQHNEAATVMVSMAQVHEKLKNYDDAERLLVEAIYIRKLVDGPGHTSVAVALNKLAHVQTCQKRFNEAITSSKKASKIIDAARRTNEHEIEYHVNHQLDIPEELETARRALATEAGQILNTRGAIHFKNRDLKLAIKDWNETIDLWEKILIETEGIANPLFAVHRNLVHLHKQNDDKTAAIEAANHFIALLDRHQPKSPLLPTAHLFVCQVYEHFDDLQSAHKSAVNAHKVSLAISGHSEETDDLEETAHLIQRRIEKRLRDEEDDSAE